MLKVGIMLEGQNGLNWERWKEIAQLVEELGFSSLHRSDHFTNTQPPDLDSLELWVSLTWLATHTERIEFGPLVTPLSFRHPVFTARMGKDVSSLSDGRLLLGVGAGWQEREHELFGFDLLDPDPRFDRFEEGLEVIYRLIRQQGKVEFQGEYYQLKGAELLPRLEKSGQLPLLVGGNGRNRTLPLTARFADEWNGVFLTAAEFGRLNQLLDRHCEQEGRDPTEVKRSVMNPSLYATDERDLEEKLEKSGRSQEDLLNRGYMVGTPDSFAEQLRSFEQAGAHRVMVQWLDLENTERLEHFAAHVLPQLH